MAPTTSLHGSALLVIWGSIDPEVDEGELNDWWTNEHLPERLGLPGFKHCRRYYASKPHGEDPMYQVWYEADSLGTFSSPEYMAALNNPTPGTVRFMPCMATLTRSACRILFTAVRPEFSHCKTGGVGVSMAHIDFLLPGDAKSAQDLLKNLELDLPNKLFGLSSVIAFHVIQHDEDATRAGTASKSYDAVKFAVARGQAQERAMVLIEFSALPNAPWAKHEETIMLVGNELNGRGVERYNSQLYQLICAMGE